MPLSETTNMDIVVEMVMDANPKSVLDAGCGDGLYGMLFRRYLDHYHYKYLPEHWKIRIDALDVFETYITPVHRYVYNNVIINDMLGMDRTFWAAYDLIHLGDVIEHLPMDRAKKMLADMAWAKVKTLIISTPLECPLTVRNYNGNEAESHVSSWSLSDFLELPGWRPFGYCIRMGQLTIRLENSHVS